MQRQSSCTEYNPNGTLRRVVPKTYDLLVWEQDGIQYTINSDSGLSRDDVMKVAESVR
ncbi:MAG: DUF4367 domain-containing protein [Herpetosiphonaceae bacterium]|nr:DUF4367 domain-containing protein [Herpetosiphonaceae bacterium]